MKKATRWRTRIPADYFITREDASGNFEWTIPSLLGDMLAAAEARFGARDPEYGLLGVEFTASGPRCWHTDAGKYTIVQLGMGALSDPREMWRQLGHECIHLLSPTGARDANVLEEGLAVHFERWYINEKLGGAEWNDGEFDPPYLEALARTNDLLEVDPDAIRKLRHHEPILARITADLIIRVCPPVPGDLADRLTQPFYDGPENG